MDRLEEKEILEIETLKQDLAKSRQDAKVELQRLSVEFKKIDFDGKRLILYGIAVGLGGTFALAKTLSLFLPQ
jgi:hypothetical protein